jgi:lysophospholipase L1-like esterase
MHASEIFRNKTARAIAWVAVLAILTYAMPGWISSSSATPAADLPHAIASSESHPASGANQVPGEIEDPSGHALHAFFHMLDEARSGRGRAVVCHYGDSPITNDDITSTVRRRLQSRFGDAGHGFVLAGKPWGWYGHVGVDLAPDRGWRADRMFIGKGDHRYGLGGVRFTTESAGQTVRVATSPGAMASAFDVYYLAQPEGGDLDVAIDGVPHGTIATAAPEPTSGFKRIEIDEGSHTLALTAVGNGEATLFGVVLERGATGVSYDSLGVNGAFVGLLAHYMDAEHWAEQLRHRAPSLVVLAYGANESEYEKLPMDRYDDDMREVVRRVREAVPDASILFVGPMDRGTRGVGGAIVSRPMIEKLTEHQRRIAAETGCAFFDTYTAMGGTGTVARWYAARPRLMGGDLTHPTARGAEIVGTLICDAIERAYQQRNQ